MPSLLGPSFVCQLVDSWSAVGRQMVGSWSAVVCQLPTSRQRFDRHLSDKFSMNLISLPGQLGRGDSIRFGGLTKGVVIMSTYEEFMIILTVVNVIIAILNYTHKK